MERERKKGGREVGEHLDPIPTDVTHALALRRLHPLVKLDRKRAAAAAGALAEGGHGVELGQTAGSVEDE